MTTAAPTRRPSPNADRAASSKTTLRVAGLFAGLGGLELGLHAAGHRSVLLNEIDPSARQVLRARFPDVELTGDVREVQSLPEVDLVSAGFPCQDLSQAGRTMGIGGARSGLVGEVFRLLERADPRWLLLENVPFMLQLDRGRAMRHLTEELGRLGFSWAYRVVDARAFGIPQRRQRVLLLASRREDPSTVLFADDIGEPAPPDPNKHACGFYWTEGERGLGWAVDAIPTLKGGSTIGIPSAPAIWMKDGLIGTPDIRDAERFQGFAENWTAVSAEPSRQALAGRWKMVGNAVCVPVARWVGERIASPDLCLATDGRELEPGDPWPRAARSTSDGAIAVDASMWPFQRKYQHLATFLQHPLVPLSVRAAEGFLGRAERGSLRFVDGFLDAVRAHIKTMERAKPR